MKNKLTVFISLFTLFCWSTTKGQTQEFYIGYGFIPSTVISENLDNFFDMFYASMPEGSRSNAGTPTTFGPLVIGYNYFVNEQWSVGTSYTLLHRKYTDDQNNYNTLLFRTDVHYFNNGYWQLYSGIALGISSIIYKSSTDKYSTSRFAFQLNGIGLKYGRKNWGAFSEIGYGHNGLINLGVSTRF